MTSLRTDTDGRHVADPVRLKNAALYYGSIGLSVLPIERNGKRPHRLVPHGCSDATTDPDVIRRWWSEAPQANVGIKAGDDVIIFDIDCKSGSNGYDDIEAMQEELPPLPVTPFSYTPSGGMHLFFAAPTGIVIKGRTKILWNDEPTSIDLRFGNQYVVAAPSVIDGKAYYFPAKETYLRLTDAGTLNVAKLPQDWVDVLPQRHDYSKIPHPTAPIRVPAPNRSPEQRLDDADRCFLYVEKMPAAISGQRGHDACYRVACVVFWDFGLDERQGWNVLWQYNARCQPPWSDHELGHKMKCALDPSNKTTARGWRITEGKNS